MASRRRVGGVLRVLWPLMVHLNHVRHSDWSHSIVHHAICGIEIPFLGVDGIDLLGRNVVIQIPAQITFSSPQIDAFVLERSVSVEMDGEIETDADHDRNPQSRYSVGSRGSSLDADGNVPDGPFPPFVISRQPLAIQDHITFGADFSARFRVFSFSNFSLGQN
jgi:hypothetical protein